MALEPGQRIGDRYTLVQRLGSGGMADVWLATDEMLGRQVALKFLHERFAQDAQFVERFRREAQAAAGLQHPNIVGVFDRGDDGRPPLDRDGVRRGGVAQGPDQARASASARRSS